MVALLILPCTAFCYGCDPGLFIMTKMHGHQLPMKPTHGTATASVDGTGAHMT
jgi:hypothetical protein